MRICGDARIALAMASRWLAARELHAALADGRLVLFGELDDELVRVRAVRGVYDLGVRGIVPAEGNVAICMRPVVVSMSPVRRDRMPPVFMSQSRDSGRCSSR